MGQGDYPITDEVHIAFLCFWLNAIVFCSRSVTMQKLYHLTTLIHESESIYCLSKLFLVNLYDELGQMLKSLCNQMPLSARPTMAFPTMAKCCLRKIRDHQRSSSHHQTAHRRN
ncbi:hypothetical protein AHAS_Ahas13G0279600 [Arachis hypogaea]